VFYFANDGDPELFCSSADWMERNFFRRVETAFPLLDSELRDRVIADLQTYLADNTQAWILDADGEYRRLVPGDAEAPVSAQTALLEGYGEGI